MRSMMKPRISEISQRKYPTIPHHQRTTSSDSDPLPHGAITNRIGKLRDRRSPRGSQSDPPNNKKLGTRISDLENQLVQAQQELKSLKQQLGSAEAAKKEAQEKLHNNKKKQPAKPKAETQESNTRDECPTQDDEVVEDPHRETDVFEVPLEKASIELNHPSADNGRKDTKSSGLENPSVEQLAKKDEQISQLKTMLEEKEKEMRMLSHENESLKKQVEEAALGATSKEEEMLSKLGKLEEALEVSRANFFELSEKLEAAEQFKESLEAEMKQLRVQTEQWRKAADEAAAVLSGGVDMDNRRHITDKWGSMDKHFNGIFNLGSPGAAAELVDDSNGGGDSKRKGSRIKIFGDLRKKKGQR